MDEKTRRNLIERQRQMTEEGRKQWLSAHTSRGKAYESLTQAFQWLLAKRKESRILDRDPWTEPFAADRQGVITYAEAISLLLKIIILQRDQPDMGLEVAEGAMKHEMRGDIRELLLGLHRLHERYIWFRENGNVSEFDEVHGQQALQRTSRKEESFGLQKKLDEFESDYQRRLQDMIEPSYFPGSPYLEGEVLSRINYTDTVVTLLSMLIDVVRWNEFESGDNDVLKLVETTLKRCWLHISRNSRKCGEKGVGWGWAGFTESESLEGQHREELDAVYDLDADHCKPQTYFTARVVTVLGKLYWLLAEDGPRTPVYKVHLGGISRDEVLVLLKRGLDGLLETNRVGDGWIDVEPYHTTKGTSPDTPKLQPAGYCAEAPEPSLLHTAYALCALAEPPVTTGGKVQLSEEQKRVMEAGIKFLLDKLDGPSRAFLKQIPFRHVLSRTIRGTDLAIEDECGVYVLLHAIALYHQLCDWENPVPGFDDVYQLSDDDTKPYYELAKYILEEVRDPMHDRRGFPAFGERGKNEIDKFPAIRATRAAVDAFAQFGYRQMVPGIDRILDRHLAMAREEIILELVKKYGDLEARGIRVAWGLIEADGEALEKRREVNNGNGRPVDRPRDEPTEVADPIADVAQDDEGN